jgi:hyperosmotically inducible protein
MTVCGLLLIGCAPTTNTNTNTNTNVNANANANVNANRGANANSSRRSVNANITRDEYERDKDSFAADARQLGRTIGSGANDGWLWTKTRALLASADDLRDSTINVDVDNAVVTLSGTVASAAQKSSAEKIAKSVEGVSSVKNSLTVQAGT